METSMDATEAQQNYLRRLIREVESKGETAPVTVDELEYLTKAAASALIDRLRRLVEVDQ